MKKSNFLYIVTAASFCLALLVAGSFVLRTAQPSADVIAAAEAKLPKIRVDDFAPGDVRIVFLDNLPIIIWRRNQSDLALAAEQDDPTHWKVSHSNVLGQPEPVFASDENLTLDGEWFFAIAYTPRGRGHFAQLRMGGFDGFFDPHHSGYFDLAGRIRHQGYENLTIIKAEMSENGETIQLDLNR